MMLFKDKFAVRKATQIKGFTFIEVMIALAIVSISLLALLKLHLISIRMAEKAQLTCQAVFLAEQKLAEILALGYPEERSICGKMEKDTASFTWRTEVTDLHLPQLKEANISGLRKILVDVSCEQSYGPKHIQVFTYVADRKLP
jgi:general secretion pathway protein I